AAPRRSRDERAGKNLPVAAAARKGCGSCRGGTGCRRDGGPPGHGACQQRPGIRATVPDAGAA
ncbi:MAG TPA: hypothetical protein PLG18_08785, partial [Syntrophales bacterium]|nr:hypothetical protein [Syntrophales bacterium]